MIDTTKLLRTPNDRIYVVSGRYSLIRPVKAFVFDNVWTPEGTARVTLYRSFVVGDFAVSRNFSDLGKVNGILIDDWNASLFTSLIAQDVIVNINSTILASLPEEDVHTEKFFGQAIYNSFAIGIYDTGLLSDILGTQEVAGVNPIASHAPHFDTIGSNLGTENNTRLFGFLKPTAESILYCQFEFDEGNGLEVVTCGIMQNAPVSGKDYLIFHTNSASIYLNPQANTEYDTERFFTLNFAHFAHSVLSQIPAQPVPNGTDATKLNQPFYDPFGQLNNGTATPNTNPPYDVYPGTTTPVIQGVKNATWLWQDTPGQIAQLLFRRHINAAKWLTSVFDFAAQGQPYTFASDDSPFSLKGANLNVNCATINDETEDSAPACIPNPAYKKPDGSTVDVNQWMLIPQALFGYHDGLNSSGASTGEAVPRTECSFEKIFQTQWDLIHDFCLWIGLIPVFNSIPSGGFTITFKNRSNAALYFTTIVPFESTPTAFQLAEAGISIGRIQSFLNIIPECGWNDDFYSSHAVDPPNRGDNNISIHGNGVIGGAIGGTVVGVQSNPFVVPAVSSKPGSLNCPFTFAGILAGNTQQPPRANPFAVTCTWYSSGPDYNNLGGNLVMIDNTYVFYPYLGEVFPNTSPIFSFSASPTGVPFANHSGTGSLFAPALRGSFVYTNSGGASSVVWCNSWRQMLARYYAPFFAGGTQTSFARSYATCTQFTQTSDIDGTSIVSTSWKNLQLFGQTRLPVLGPSATPTTPFYVKGYKRSWNKMTTAVDYLEVRNGSVFDNGYNDSSELTLNNYGYNSNDSGGVTSV